MSQSTSQSSVDGDPTSSPLQHPGVLLVTSDTLSPEILDRDDFDHWYTSTHIPLVLDTGRGHIGTATRYQYIPYSSALPSHPLDAPDMPLQQMSFLTVYDLQNTEWVDGEAFIGLKKEHQGPWRDAVFRHAVFNATSWTHRVLFEDDASTNLIDKPPPAGIILTIMLSHSPDGGNSEEDMQAWFEDEHLPFFSRIAGYRTSRLSSLHSKRVVRRLKVNENKKRAPRWLVVHEFDGMRIPGIGFRDAESEMGRLKQDVEGLTFGGGDDQKGERERGEVDSAFWSLMGEYWATQE